MPSKLLLPILHERFPGRGLTDGTPPDPCAVFPGIHPAIHRAAIFDDGRELTLCIDPLMHGHFSEYDMTLSKSEREQLIVERIVEFLDALFSDRVVVWKSHNSGGWYRVDFDPTAREPNVQEYCWSGPRTYR